MKPAGAEHRKAQAAPNSSGVPKRLAGTTALRSALACSNGMPLRLGVRLDIRAQPVGIERAREQEIDGDVGGGDRAGNAGHEGGEAGAGAGRRSRPASGIFTEPE